MNNPTEQVKETKIMSPYPQRYDIAPVLCVTAMTNATAQIKVFQDEQGMWVLYKDVEFFLQNKLKANSQKSIEEIGLSTHAINILKRSGLNTVEDINKFHHHAHDLLKLRGMGMKTYNEIISKIYQ